MSHPLFLQMQGHKFAKNFIQLDVEEALVENVNEDHFTQLKNYLAAKIDLTFMNIETLLFRIH